MVYASTNEVLKKAFHGIKHFEVHDEDEFSYEAIAEELSSKDRAWVYCCQIVSENLCQW